MTLEKNLDLLRNDLSKRGKSAGGLLAISPQESEIRKKKKKEKKKEKRKERTSH